MKQKKTKKKNLPSIPEGKSILKPLSIEAIGSNGDPCFGLSYDLTTDECKMCGDSELCCIKFAAKMGTTRKEIESESQFKDLESLIDAKALKKTIRALKRKGVVKNCDKCNKYKEVPYSDCVSCDDDLSLFDPTVESDLCRQCIELNPVKFEASMLDHIGSSIFLNPDDFWKSIDNQKGKNHE